MNKHYGKAETPLASQAVTAQGQTDSDLNSLQVKVAELLGFRPHRPGGPNSPVIWWFKGGVPIHLPNYPSDLNACAEFEKGLTTSDKWYYLEKLTILLGFDHSLRPNEWGEFSWQITTATAEQRCRAFVATMEASRPDRAADSVEEPLFAHTALGKPKSVSNISCVSTPSEAEGP